MKEILLLRHAKSDWNAAFSRDHERPLNERGRGAAAAVGEFLSAANRLPDRILCSTAVRARKTLDLAREAGAWPPIPTEFLEDFYGAGPATLVTACRELDPAVDRVLLVGHEPGWSHTVGLLIGGADVRMATATVACVAFDAPEWTRVGSGQGQLRFLLPPRLLEALRRN